MITGKEVKVLDKNAEFFGTPQEKLMEEAGKQLACFIDESYDDPSIVIFCGLGNNGGDGFVAARYLSKNHPVSLFLVGEENHIHTSIARMNFTKLKQMPLKIYDIRSLSKIESILKESNVIVDAMLGIGLSGDLRNPFDTITNQINESGKEIIACDVPTGLGLPTTIQPHHTITFHDTKEGMNEKNCGTIHVKPIGIPKNASIYVGPGELSEYYPKPKKESHKGQNGRVLIIGGGPFTGAPALSALAALRTGADLVTVAVPQEVFPIVASFAPDIITKPLLSESHFSINDVDRVKELSKSVDAVLIGPGLGDHKETMASIHKVIKDLVGRKVPLVIDADGIVAMSDHHDCLLQSNTIITPHTTEFNRFTKESLWEKVDDQEKQVSSWAKKIGIGIFKKGPTDIMSNGEITRLNIIHNEAMTVGGTGDVLAGIIVGLLSKKTSIINTMRIAAFLNGEAGNMAFEQYSYGMCASDVIEMIPQVLKKYL